MKYNVMANAMDSNYSQNSEEALVRCQLLNKKKSRAATSHG